MRAFGVMSTYRITSKQGVDLGTYMATSPGLALDLSARGVGYPSHEAMCARYLSRSTPAPPSTGILAKRVAKLARPPHSHLSGSAATTSKAGRGAAGILLTLLSSAAARAELPPNLRTMRFQRRISTSSALAS